MSTIDKHEKYTHCLLQALLVDRHLYRDVRQIRIDEFVRHRGDGRVVFGILMELRDRAQTVREVNILRI
jgi:hypothetical protein